MCLLSNQSSGLSERHFSSCEIDNNDMITDLKSNNYISYIFTRLNHCHLFPVVQQQMQSPFVDIQLVDMRKLRPRRSPIPVSSNDNRCLRRDLTIDFGDFGWDWIIAPKKYDANYCRGECNAAYKQQVSDFVFNFYWSEILNNSNRFDSQYPHTHVMQMSNSASPCCSPSKMGKIQLLYFDTDSQIVLSSIPNMRVEECFCS